MAISAISNADAKRAFREWVATTKWPSLSQHAHEPFVAGYKAGWADAAEYVKHVQMLIHLPAEGDVQ